MGAEAAGGGVVVVGEVGAAAGGVFALCGDNEVLSPSVLRAPSCVSSCVIMSFPVKRFCAQEVGFPVVWQS